MTVQETTFKLLMRSIVVRLNYKVRVTTGAGARVENKVVRLTGLFDCWS